MDLFELPGPIFTDGKSSNAWSDNVGDPYDSIPIEFAVFIIL